MPARVCPGHCLFAAETQAVGGAQAALEAASELSAHA